MTPQATDWDGIPGFWHLGRFYPEISGAQDPDPSAGGGSTEGASSGATGDPPAGTDPATSGGTSGDGKTLTQEQVNAIVAREVDRAKRGKLDPSDLGFDSAKEAREFIDQAKKFYADQKSDSDKALEEAKAEAKAAAKAEILDVANERVLRAEFMLAAMENNVTLPHDAFVLAQSDTEMWKTVEMDDNGAVMGLDKGFFEALKEKKPFLFGRATGTQQPPGNIDAGAQGAGGNTGGPLTPERRAELQKRYGVLDRIATDQGAAATQTQS